MLCAAAETCPDVVLIPYGHAAYYAVVYILTFSEQPAAELAAPDMLQRHSC